MPISVLLSYERQLNHFLLLYLKIYPLDTLLHHTEQRKSLRDLFYMWDISLGAVHSVSLTHTHTHLHLLRI